MKRFLIAVILIAALVLSGCSDTVATEQTQTDQNFSAILANQPVPNLGGYSLERQIVIETMLARNRVFNTWTYLMEYGQIVEVCASIGYPIPYSTQLTNPEQYHYNGATLPNPEPNALYIPDSSEASIVSCVNPDGSVSPGYFEPRAFALPYRIKADRVLERIDADAVNGFSIEVGQ